MKNNIFNLRALLISCFLVLGMSAFAQVTASGTVTDAANGEPIIGASILEVGTTNGTITDFAVKCKTYLLYKFQHCILYSRTKAKSVEHRPAVFSGIRVGTIVDGSCRSVRP